MSNLRRSPLTTTILLIAGLTLACADIATAQAGWNLVHSVGDEEMLRCVEAIDASSAVAVGDKGRVMLTTDRGASWTPRWIGLRTILHGAHFFDSTTGFVAGGSGSIYRTVDGGRQWARQTNASPPFGSEEFRAISFANRDTGIAVATAASIFRTTDGGSSWELRPAAASGAILHKARLRGPFGVAVGDSGRIFTTTNAGATWITQISETSHPLYDVWIHENGTISAVGAGGTFLRSATGGATWTRLGISTHTLTSIHWNSLLIGHVGTLNGNFLRTTDGGQNWTQLDDHYTGQCADLVLFDAVTAVVVHGYPPQRSVDACISWAAANILPGTGLNGVSTTAPASAIVVGDGGVIYTTGDGGLSWTPRASGTTLDLEAIACAGPSICTAVGDSGIILRTTDGGASWFRQTSGLMWRLWSVSCLDASRIWAVGDGALLRTTDGGFTWLGSPGYGSEAFRGVSFGNATDGMAVGDSLTLRSTTGGVSWEPLFHPPRVNFEAVSMVDGSRATAVGAMVFPLSGGSLAFVQTTADHGASWRYEYDLHSSSRLDGISRPSPDLAIAVGEDGSILRSEDGAISWVPLLSPTANDLNDISMSDSANGFAVGEGETILRTVNGGITSAPPYLTTPFNGEGNIHPRYVRLGWHYDRVGLRSRLQLSTDLTFQSAPLIDTTLAPGEFPTISGLAYSTYYFWRVQGLLAGVPPSEWSSTSRFRTRPYDQPGVRVAQTRSHADLELIEQNQDPGSPDYPWRNQASALHPLDTVSIVGTCVVPPGVLRGPEGSSRFVIRDTAGGSSPWWSYLIVDMDPTGVAVPGPPRPGDVVAIVGTIREIPDSTPHSTTVLKAVRIQPTFPSRAPVRPHDTITVDILHPGSFPWGFARFTAGEPREGSHVEIAGLTVVAEPDPASGLIHLEDRAGNAISISDDSRWFTVRGHRDPASTFTLPASGTYFSRVRGIVLTVEGPDNSRGFCLAPLYPGDMEAGSAPPGLIEGIVLGDRNADGHPGPGEDGVPSWSVSLGGPSVLQALTSPTGSFRFRGLEHDSYYLSYSSRPFWVATVVQPSSMTLAPGADSIRWAIIGQHYRGNHVGGQVTAESGGEEMTLPAAGTPGWSVTLHRPDGDETIVTGPGGKFLFDSLSPGPFTISAADSIYWYRTFPESAATHAGTVTEGTALPETYNFRFRRQVKARIEITVLDTLSGIGKTLRWGVRPGTSTGMWGAYPGSRVPDSLEGEFEIPPRSFSQITGIFDARFSDPSAAPGSSTPLFGEGGWTDIRDFRAPSQTDSFLLSFLPARTAGGGYPILLTWRQEDLARYFSGPVQLSDIVGTIVDMKATSRHLVTDDRIASVKIVATSPVLPEGRAPRWKLVSIPNARFEGLADLLFPSRMGGVYGFDRTSGYYVEDTLRQGFGYWVSYRPALDTMLYSPGEFTRDTVELTAGWNLFGSLSGPVDPASITTVPEGILPGIFWGFLGEYFRAATLAPTYGYWVYADAPGTMILDAGASARPSSARNIFSTIDESYRITFTDAQERTGKLFISRDSVDSRRFLMPPPPPGGAFDVRYASDAMLESIPYGVRRELPILIRSAGYPVRVNWEGTPSGMGLALKVGPVTAPLDKGGAIEILLPTERVTLSVDDGPALPTEFSLAQNWPNPFNPSTLISYSLPVDSRVTLKLYDLLGREVRSLVDDFEAAGVKRVALDGTDLPSGVYFYELHAGSFRQVRKMALVK